MKKNRMKQITLFLCFCMIFTMPAFAGMDFEATATSDLTMQFVQRPDVDVVLTVGNSAQDISSFETDLLAKLAEKNIDSESVNIQAIETTTVSTNGVGAKAIFDTWENYPSNAGGWLYDEATQSVGSRVNTSWTGYWKDASTEGITMECDLAQLDALNGSWVDNDLMGLTFRMNLNGDAINLNNYSYYFYTTDGGGIMTPGLYKKNENEYYKGTLLQADDWYRQDGIWYTVKIVVNGANIQVYKKDPSTGEYVEHINYTDPDPLPAGGYGVFTYSQANGNFKNFSIISESVKRFSEVIRQPSWRESAERFIINLDDGLIGDFEDEMKLSEILYRTLNEDIHYIGWGNNSNEAQANAFIADNNGMGAFVNRDTKAYSDAIDQIAAYIAGKVNAKTIVSKGFDLANPEAVGTFVVSRPISITVNPADLKSNTVTTEYPNGRWRVDHDPNFYDNPSGTMWWDNADQDDLPEEYTQPGEYDFYFEDTLVSKLNFHRKPVAKFVFNTSGNTITNLSYDLDGEIVAHAWKWKEVTATSSTEVSDRNWILREPIPADFLAGREYIVQLRVLDEQNVWSGTTSKYISTTTTITSVPIADFSMSPEYLQKHLGTSIAYTDKSYDPQGRAITDALWTVFAPDGSKVHEAATPLTDFAAKGQGNYTIQLKVENDLGIWSEVYTKSLTVVDDLVDPTIEINETAGMVPRNPWELTLTFSDEGGSGFKRQSVTLLNTSTGVSTPLGWSSAKTKSISLSEDGIWSITAVAEDQKGNTTSKTFTGYIVDATAPSEPTITGISSGWTSHDVTISIGGSSDANAITYEYAISDEMPADSGWVAGTSKTLSSTGEYRIWAKVIDVAGNASSPVNGLVKIDKTAPVYTTMPASRSIEVFGTYAQDLVEADDPESGIVGEIIIDASAVKTDLVGKYLVIYWIKNGAGTMVPNSQMISVVDTTIPTLALSGELSVDVEVHTSYLDAGATARDNYDAADAITAAIVPSDNIDLDIVGPYAVTYNVSDANGNAAVPITRTVNIVDTTAPKLFLTGAPSVDVEVHGSYTDAGAMATDNYDAADAITAAIVPSDDIDLDTVGTYTVTYRVTDVKGNAAEAITRTVNVVDTTIPVITVEGENPVDTEAHLAYADAGASATDNYDSADAITAAIEASNNLDLHTVGAYAVTYNATDINGNVAVEKTRTVNVVDTTIPVLALVGAPSVDVEVHTSYSDDGATATDNYDDDEALTAAIVPSDNIDLDIVGTYTVTYVVTDANGNMAVSISRTVNVVDTIVPVLYLTGEAEIFMDQGDPYADAGATATDNYDSDEVITAAIRLTNPLDVNSIETYTLQYDATDTNGNEAESIERVIHVVHPLAVSTSEAERVGSYEATFKGAIDHYGVKQVMEHGFVYDRDAEKTNLMDAEGVLQLGAQAEAVGFKVESKLSPSTIYYVRAYAVKAEGVVYGEMVEVRTQAVPAKPVSAQTFGDTVILRINPDRLNGHIQTSDAGITSLDVTSDQNVPRQKVEIPLLAVDQVNAIALRDEGEPQVSIGTPIGTMDLPTENLGSSTLIPNDFEGDLSTARLHVTIENVEEATIKAMEEATGVYGVVAPIRFDLNLKVDVSIDERTTRVETTPIDAFENLVVRTISAPETEYPLMAVVFDEEAQTWVPVLSRTIVDENGNQRVEILHREMGTYTLIERTPQVVLGIEGHEAKDAIEALASFGVLPYREGTRYQPNMGITRAEMTYTMVRLMGITKAQGEAVSYSDADRHQYEREIQLATQAGIFTGYDDGLFRGDQVITREELAAVVERALQYVEMTDGLDPEMTQAYHDAEEIDFWSIDSVGRLTDAGIIDKPEHGRYRPQADAMKAEAATMLANFLKMIGMI